MTDKEQKASPLARAGARLLDAATRGLRFTRLGRVEQRLVRLERLATGGQSVYLGNNRVAVKVVVGRERLVYLVEADDRLITPRFAVTGQYETATTAFLADTLRAGAHCVDAGANFGYFTCLMGQFCPHGRVVAIEPVASLARLARDNVAINGLLERVEVVEAAISNDATPVTLYRRDTRQGNTSIVPAGAAFTEMLGEGPAVAFQAPALRIDDLLPRLGGRIDLLKIDVEGAEPLAFQGAARTLATNPQITIVMEWSPGQIASAGFDVRAFVEGFRAHGLSVFDLRSNGRLAPLSIDRLVGLPYRAGIVLCGPAAR